MKTTLYCLMGGSKDVADGPTAILSHMTLLFTQIPSDCLAEGEFRNGNSPPEAILLAFFVGIILFGIAFLQLGWITNYLSHTIIVAFIQANAITIPAAQLKEIFGFPSADINSEFFIELYDYFTHLYDINWADFTVGWLCVIFLVCCKIMLHYVLKARAGFRKKGDYCYVYDAGEGRSWEQWYHRINWRTVGIEGCIYFGVLKNVSVIEIVD